MYRYEKTKVVRSNEEISEASSSNQSIKLIMQMYQMAHNELLVRIQQRDQYYICIIGVFFAVLVGLFNLSTTPGELVLKVGVFLGFALMLFLTFLLSNSCKLHEDLVSYVKELETLLQENNDFETLKITMWQLHIDSKNPNHREKSFNKGREVFYLLDVIVGVAVVLVLSGYHF